MKRGATAILRAPQRVPSLTPTVTSWEFFWRSCQGLKSECPCVTPHVPGGSSPELEPICMCFTPALFFLTSLPHGVDRRQLPQSLWGTIRDSGVLSDLPRVALSSSCQGRSCAVPPDAGGCPGLVGPLLYWYKGRDEWWAPACFFGGQCTVLVAPTVTRLALGHESVLLDRVWALKLEAV